MFIVFEDYEGNEYDYIPRWDEMVTINKAKKDIDDLNKDLYKENNK